ncbi:hypothetical protein [Nocardia terpenica]|uniref:IrrE N-terminal-like domain-containing protein n=1 Tax=Nocardia terpenica TaxID=455432 RepID=A0A6G9YVA6_9NOCA|nr:hypothetical protein [Nocardia terpenica]QIS17148.1 hypothetical protein F6W96_01270 [Nocardia terpenica]
MGRRTQRRRSARMVADFVTDLRLSMPAEPERVMDAICDALTRRLGRPVTRMPVTFPPAPDDVVSGLWIHADDGHYLCYEQNTSPWHQLVIFCHETGHLVHEHDRTPLLDTGEPNSLLPSLDPGAVQRIMAERSGMCRGPAEARAEMFAARLLTHVSRWLPERQWPVTDSAADAVHRMETTFGLPRAHGRV